jgi:hypothetical protein
VDRSLGAPWRDLPDNFRNWNSIWRRFRRWVLKGVFDKVFQAMAGDPGLRIRDRRWNARSGPPTWDRHKMGTQNQAIGPSRGGLTTNILALVDGLADLVRFTLWPGHRHDRVGVEPILEGIDFVALLADKALDSDVLRLNLD